MKRAEHPFRFVTASYLTRIANHKTRTLRELEVGLKACSDASIFYHTFQSLGRLHSLTGGGSNDFVQWVLAAFDRPEIAEKLASLDIRDYLSLTELRGDLWRMVHEYCEAFPHLGETAAFEPFYFCEAVEVTVPLGAEASTLEEFAQHLELLDNHSFHFHFIASRLRLHLRTNDFSCWSETSLGLPQLAKRINQIDICTNTLESARKQLLAFAKEELVR